MQKILHINCKLTNWQFLNAYISVVIRFTIIENPIKEHIIVISWYFIELSISIDPSHSCLFIILKPNSESETWIDRIRIIGPEATRLCTWTKTLFWMHPPHSHLALEVNVWAFVGHSRKILMCLPATNLSSFKWRRAAWGGIKGGKSVFDGVQCANVYRMTRGQFSQIEFVSKWTSRMYFSWSFLWWWNLQTVNRFPSDYSSESQSFLVCCGTWYSPSGFLSRLHTTTIISSLENSWFIPDVEQETLAGAALNKLFNGADVWVWG